MLRYNRNEAVILAVMGDSGFMATGDLAKCDGEGRLYIVGRFKELIIRNGFNVYPVEVESVISLFAGIAQVAVVGRPVFGNEEVVAFVHLSGHQLHSEALTAGERAADSLQEACRDHRQPGTADQPTERSS
jgi:acyl-CoA synthetase (AMP-forming)/AMP-acid ligase II